MLAKSNYLYAAYYCEENIWHLANQAQSELAKVVFISNTNRQCALWNQALATGNEPVVWDYHVIMLDAKEDEWRVYDFDTTLPWGVSLGQYLLHTFNGAIRADYLPLFRVISASEFLRLFSSDRRHMRDQQGGWLQSPPDWAPICDQSVHNLDQFVAMDQTGETGPGDILDLQRLRQRPPFK